MTNELNIGNLIACAESFLQEGNLELAASGEKPVQLFKKDRNGSPVILKLVAVEITIEQVQEYESFGVTF